MYLMTILQLQLIGFRLTFLAMTLFPTSVLAAQQTPDSATATPAPTAERDPYLSQAINNLPNYTYQQAGFATASLSPRTQSGNWPQPVKVAAVVAPAPRPAPVPLVPAGGALLVLEGEASYYSRAGCLGCSPALRMANGQPLDDNALTMAIGANLKHFVGHTAKVTSLATGKSVTVRITDTGGFYQAKYGHRVADLTVATKNAIGMAGGVGQVRVEVF